ncbi:MAG: hypothetical protein HKN29_02945, partial [Rhodothermales bacterium]|nr:hypothetical protein [Rhodothermales bacterium]
MPDFLSIRSTLFRPLFAFSLMLFLGLVPPGAQGRQLEQPLETVWSGLADGNESLTLRSVHHSVADGLPTDMIKDVAHDPDGFLWIATDQGLVHYDGGTFQTYTLTEGLPSNFVKSVYVCRDGNTIATTDLGVVQVVRSENGYRFDLIAEATATETDAALYYPKTLYQDREERIWGADTRGVFWLSEDGPQMYILPAETWPDSFTRTYRFTEVGSDLIVSSEAGQLFRFDREGDRIERLSLEPAWDKINDIEAESGNSVLLATNTGLHRYDLSSGATTRVGHEVILHDLHRTADGTLLVGSSESGLYVLTMDGQLRPVPEFEGRTVNAIHSGPDGKAFVASDQGLFILYAPFFSPQFVGTISGLGSFVKGDDGSLLSLEGESVYAWDPTGTTKREIPHLAESLMTVAGTAEETWMGTLEGQVYVYRSGQEARRYDLPSGRAVSRIAPDPQGGAWAIQLGEPGVTYLNPDGTALH